MAAPVPSIHQRLTRRTKVRNNARSHTLDKWIRLKPLHSLLKDRPHTNTTDSALNLDEWALIFCNHLHLGSGLPSLHRYILQLFEHRTPAVHFIHNNQPHCTYVAIKEVNENMLDIIRWVYNIANETY
jgi:hypothetical protein